MSTMPMPSPLPAGDAAQPLAILAQLEQRIRACPDETTLRLLLVNDVHSLVPYRQAVLWQRASGHAHGRITALSGMACPDANAPMNAWLCALIDGHANGPSAEAAGAFAPTQAQRDAWREHLPEHAWWLPLPLEAKASAPGQLQDQAVLVLFKTSAWSAREQALLALVSDAAAHAWRALRCAGAGPKQRLPLARRFLRGRRWLWALGALAMAALLLPVHQTVLAPAEVVARAPMTVRAPLSGVIDSVAVQPNESVVIGQVLARFDSRELQGQLDAARQALAVADAQWQRSQQLALFDAREKSELPLLQSKRAQASADVDFYQQALARTQLRAERDGIALFDDPADWVGKPVALGERIMQIAAPQDGELEIELPVADAIALPADAKVRLFLNTAPASPVPAHVSRMAYRASASADGTLAYRVRARFEAEPDAPMLRVGQKGTAKLYGERTVLGLYVLRKPLAAVRVWLGV